MVSNIPNRGIRYAKFLLHPRPQEDELLSSWLTRIAYEHNTNPPTFINLYLPEWEGVLCDRDIDISADDKLLKILTFKSGFNYKTLYNLTLKSYEGYLFEHITPKSRNFFIQPIGNRYIINRKYGLRYCPLCLKNGKFPYFRKKWRLSFSTACIRHKCFLTDRCSDCGSLTILYKWHHDSDFPHCYKCGLSFKETKPEYINPDSYGLKAIKRLYKILDTGIFNFENNYTYSFFFFTVLKYLTKVVYHSESNTGFLDHEIMNKSIIHLNKKPKQNLIENVPLKEQYLLFSGLMKMFEDFPKYFIEFCNANGLLKTKLSKDMKYIPFWYKEIINTFSREHNTISLEEIKSVIRYLEKRRIMVTKSRVGRVMGICPNFKNRKDVLRLFANNIHSH
jgi:hypothetical protein